MGVENNDQELRIIDHALLEDSLDKRAELLDQFLAERLKVYVSQVQTARQVSREAHAQEFGQSLVTATKDMLNDERAHKLRTNWNRPQEERKLCFRTAMLGKEYYLASKSERRGIVVKCLKFFTHLPMPLEEMAFEELAIHGKHWKPDMPLEERRIWLKIEKGGYLLKSGTESGPWFPPRVELPPAAEPEQNPRTPARKRFAEIRRSKSRH